MTPAQRKRNTITSVPVAENPFDIEDAKPATLTRVNGVAADALRSFVERIERLMEEKRGVADDIKEVKTEAKIAGFDVKVLNVLIKIRTQDADDLAKQEALLDIYKATLGMLP